MEKSTSKQIPNLEDFINYTKKDIENWLEPFWDEMYLRSRLPVVDLTWKSRSIDFRDTCPTN